ncbi:MAG: VWA domain-containing protein, partial [Proteobacteria bacterium]|nr:VWA domain-containing protein [Burkholderiales bacterium]
RRRSAPGLARLETVDAGGRRIDPTHRRRDERLPRYLWLIAFIALALAIARPQAVLPLPTRLESVILAVDVSGSMRATDLKPNRIAAAQEAAKAFIQDQPEHVRIGVVAVAGTAALTQSPTRNREELVAAIDRFQLQRGTALGAGLLIALVTMLPDSGIDTDAVMNGRAAQPALPDPLKKSAGEPFKPVPPGSNSQAAIVLLSDGQSNTGPEVLKIAELAAERGVRIFTVGMGTPEGITLSAEGWSMRVRLDEDVLKKVAAVTEGEYFRAANTKELSDIYRGLSRQLTFDKQQLTEITALFVGLAGLLMATAAVLSMARFGRIL